MTPLRISNGHLKMIPGNFQRYRIIADFLVDHWQILTTKCCHLVACVAGGISRRVLYFFGVGAAALALRGYSAVKKVTPGTTIPPATQATTLQLLILNHVTRCS